MAEPILTLTYSNIANISYPNKAGMKKHLSSERDDWRDFFTRVHEHPDLQNIPNHNGGTNIRNLTAAFDILLKDIDDGDVGAFNRRTQPHYGNLTLPPPASSIEGQLILGLFNNDRPHDALCVYLAFISQTLKFSVNANQPIGKMVARGTEFFVPAYAAAALPFRRVSSQRLASATKSAEAQVESLLEEVKKAQKTNSSHQTALDSFRSLAEERFKRLEQLLIKRERHRRFVNTSWARDIDHEVDKRFQDAERRLSAIDQADRQKQEARQKEFDRLLDLFHAQLRLRAPVKLWESRSEQHGNKSVVALSMFIILTVLAILIGGVVPYFYGDYIAESFFVQVCDQSEPPNCERQFSAKGPLTIAGILTIMSLLLWAIRLQYRIYLSERHLALDASEKQAFAETYLALKEGEDVGSGNEAIVLASLFRPTQDGIIKDDDGMIDLSAAAILAKQLGRGNN